MEDGEAKWIPRSYLQGERRNSVNDVGYELLETSHFDTSPDGSGWPRG